MDKLKEQIFRKLTAWRNAQIDNTPGEIQQIENDVAALVDAATDQIWELGRKSDASMRRAVELQSELERLKYFSGFVAVKDEEYARLRCEESRLKARVDELLEHNTKLVKERRELKAQIASGALPEPIYEWDAVKVDVPAEAQWGGTHTVKFKQLRTSAKMPKRATDGAVGFDVHACYMTTITPAPVRVMLGIAVELPPHLELQIRPRSGLSLKGITCAFGTIDPDYRGEIATILSSPLGASEVKAGERVCQLVIAPRLNVSWQEVEELNETKRGVNGFGSTGS